MSAEQSHTAGRQEARVAVVILNWNGLQDTIECLHSVMESDYASFDVIVVDNGSTDGSTTEIPRQFPSITFIPTGVNLGWAGGNNIGIKHALACQYPYVFLLNNDTTISRTCISYLVGAAAQTGPALVHPAIYYYDEPEIAQLDPTATSMADTSKPDIVPLDHAYGAALFISADVFQRIGLIDEQFFLQLEEADYFLRAKAAGINSFCAPHARVLHKESRSFGGKVTPVKTYYIVRNSLLVLSKHPKALGGYGAGLKRFLWTIIGMISRARGLNTAWRPSDLFWIFSSDTTARAIRFGILDYLSGRFGSITQARNTYLVTSCIEPPPKIPPSSDGV